MLLLKLRLFNIEQTTRNNTRSLFLNCKSVQDCAYTIRLIIIIFYISCSLNVYSLAYLVCEYYFPVLLQNLRKAIGAYHLLYIIVKSLFPLSFLIKMFFHKLSD